MTAREHIVHEHTLNTEIARVLSAMRPRWHAVPEAMRMIQGSNERPDFIVHEEDGPAVVIENEIAPANNVEEEARSRLGKMTGYGDFVHIVVALCSPKELRTGGAKPSREKILAADNFQYALFSGDSEETAKRFPLSGWISGGVRDFAEFVFRAAFPKEIVDAAATKLEESVQKAAAQAMEKSKGQSPYIAQKIAAALKQEESEQTMRMAMTIIANAFIFHETIAGMYPIQSPDELRAAGVGRPFDKQKVLDEWAKILEINYWPIFDIARKVLNALPSNLAKDALNEMHRTASNLVADGISRSHDLSGRVFQRLIADRKFLATFYTRPAAAILLAGLAIPEDFPFDGGSWKNDAHRYLTADFACGTGTLLSAAYHRIAELHEFDGGDMAKKHGEMMKHALIGCDVMPSAVHLTASMLSGMHPAEKFTDTRLYTLPYGSAKKGEYSIGSLELLESQSIFPMFATAAEKIKATGKEDATPQEIPSTNLVIMNPPFTRPTNHEGRHSEIPNPAFAAFGADAELQKELGERSKKLRAETCGHGNAGIASDFVALADKLVKPGGVVALVLPLTVLAGDSWKKVRELWAKSYRDIRVVSLSATETDDCSFSADTGMGEILLVGRKNGRGEKRAARGVFIVLNKRPENEIEGAEYARTIRRHMRSRIRKLEDGPFGETELSVGESSIGGILDAPIPAAEEPWAVARISDFSIAQTAYALVNGKLWLPQKRRGMDFPISQLGNFARRGFIARDINGYQPNGEPRGPFDVQSPCPKTATFPCLWAHDAKRETQMEIEPDSECIARISMEKRALEVWETASRAHHNINFRFNSQPLAVAMTEKPTIGGDAWPNVIFPNPAHEFIYALWGNSTLGLLIYWWWSSKQQGGRGRISGARMLGMPTLDVTRLSVRQLRESEKAFNILKTKRLLPFFEADKDDARKELDETLTIKILGLDNSILEGLDILRAKLCAEPSVRGSK